MRPDHPRSRTALALLAAGSPALAPASVAGQAASPLPPEARSAWEAVVADWRKANEEGGIVGASVALVVDGRIAARAHHGMADLEADRPVDDGTLFHWASITKTLTAVALLQLRERGLLPLDDPAVAWVPELREVHAPHGPVEGVTLRHLLSHSAGFRSPTWPWGGDEPWHPWEPTRWSQLVAMMPYTEVEFEPGSRFRYSNPGIVFLGRALEAATGDVYEAYVEKNVLRPLGMGRSYFDGTPWHLEAHRSENYRVVDGDPVPNGDFDTGVTVSNGGLNGPVEDLARWVAFLMGSHPAGEAVLPRDALREMWQPVVPTGGGPAGLGTESMGLSFFLYDRPDGTRLVGHTGTQRSFYSFILLDPERRVGAVAAWNTGGGDGSGPDTGALRDRLRVRMADEVFPRVEPVSR